MASLLDNVNARTQLVGQNRLELLLFNLEDDQIYGINVFKVKEVINCPSDMSKIPNSNPLIFGVATLRDGTIPIIDLSKAIGKAPISDIDNCFIIVTEYNRSVQGFIVNSVDRIINIYWENVLPAPTASGQDNYLTAITELDDKLVEILDVEKVLTQIVGLQIEFSDDTHNAVKDAGVDAKILVVDDSSVARKQIKRVLDHLDVECTLANDGSEAFDILKDIADSGESIYDHFDMVITDIEMPKMDGYTLTTRIKADDRMKDMYVLLHTSLSGVFNNSMVEKVGANAFIAKFNKDDLANAIMEWVHSDKK